MALSAAYAALALKLQESAGDLSSDDVAARLRDSISDEFRNSGEWAYFVTYFGDSESGEVIYSQGGDTRKATYEISGTGGAAAKCVIDFSSSLNVVPRTVYEEEADEPAAYAAMEESLKVAKLYTALPLYERFISKKERDSADASSFAGKNRSFPILSQSDVEAAFHALGRAGADNYSVSTIRANIIRIAKAKGFKLPKSAERAAKTKESADVSRGTLELRESVGFPVDVQLSEAFGGDFRSSYNICLIKPGRGSSAIYPAEVLKRDGPKVFKAGTPMRIDHPTRAEEAARPEGSVKDWGAVLESDAIWNDNGPQGPALYGRVKPFSDHVATIHEKGPFAGVSIRANGNAVMESGRVKMQDGLPVLAELTAAEGVDMVTRAGAGGMFLSESARTAPNSTEGQVEMTETEKLEIARLIESGIKAATLPLRERAMKGDALFAGHKTLKGVAFSEEQKSFVIEEAIRGGLPEKDGALDEEKFGVLVMAEARRLGRVIGGGAEVRGLGVAVGEAGKKNCPTCEGSGENSDGEDCEDCGGSGKMKAKESARRQPDEDAELAGALVSALGLSESAAKRAAKGRD